MDIRSKLFKRSYRRSHHRNRQILQSHVCSREHAGSELHLLHAGRSSMDVRNHCIQYHGCCMASTTKGWSNQISHHGRSLFCNLYDDQTCLRNNCLFPFFYILNVENKIYFLENQIL